MAITSGKYGSLYDDPFYNKRDMYGLTYEQEIARKYEYEMAKREEQIRRHYEEKLRYAQTGWTSSTNSSVNMQFNQVPMPNMTPAKSELQKMQDEVEAYCKQGRRDPSSERPKKEVKNIISNIIAA